MGQTLPTSAVSNGMTVEIIRGGRPMRHTTLDTQDGRKARGLTARRTRAADRGAWLPRHGIERVDRRADGVGYLRLVRFHGSAAARATAVAAVARLADAEVIVFDLRRHTGGDAAMGALLTSLLYDTEPLYADAIWRGGTPLPSLTPEARCARQRVEVLVSGATSGVGIAFASNLARLGRATVRTAPPTAA